MNFSTRFQRFMLRHRDKGIPNLMLYIVLGCGVVTLLCQLGLDQLYDFLVFDRDLILRGQVWRLFTYILTLGGFDFFMSLIVLYCTYSLGHAVERAWGTFKFNMFLLSGILLMDIFVLIFGGHALIYDSGTFRIQEIDSSSFYAQYTTWFLHLSLVLCFSTLYSENQFLIFFIIPIKAWVMSLLYFIYIGFMVLSMTFSGLQLPHNLFPLVGLLNYFLFIGKDAANLLPLSWRVKLKRRKQKRGQAPSSGTIPFRPSKDGPTIPYTHRCTVCGRTDVSDPGLEFRYCSRCSGYHCYCADHISNHSHIQ